MQKWLRCLLIFLFLILAVTQAQAQLRKQRLFKVDPLSFMFKELRVAVEHRLFKDKDYFWYLSPYGYHQFWRSKSSDRYGRPTHPQKYYGVGLRAGARRYFIPAKSSPHGFFVQGHVGFRQLWLHNYNTDLQITDKTRYLQFNLGGTAGYQWITGPRKDFAYGFIGGFEFFTPPLFPSGSGYTEDNLTSNWYEFPFLDGGHTGFRLYLGIELGFAFLQRDLHW
jgi:hypothetical protein